MSDYPRSLPAFQQLFPDDKACAAHLFRLRWPDGFRCPACGKSRAWPHGGKRFTFQCADCGRQTSVTSGTVMHGSKLPLTVWFWAAYLVASHSNGISALQLRSQLGLGSYKTAWLLLTKLRRAMVVPGRDPLLDAVEVDEASIPFRTKNEPPDGGQGRSHRGKILIAGAAEVKNPKIGRIRIAKIKDYTKASLTGFIDKNIAKGAQIGTDGFSSYANLEGVSHKPKVVGGMPAHILLPWVHRVFSNLKTWGLGVYHGLRKKHIQAYLDEFTFRFNRRKNRHAGFATLLRVAVEIPPATDKMLIAPESTG